jgi:phenylacetaldehyde dehydrogenase
VGIDAATFWLNTNTPFDPARPFGGVRDSGLGRDLGEIALLSFTEPKSVVMAL